MMQRTNEIRFVERQVPIKVATPLSSGSMGFRTLRILQQKWALYWSDDMGGDERESEWRDVPVEKEL